MKQSVVMFFCFNFRSRYNKLLRYSGLEINFMENWPIGYLSQILAGQTISFTGHMQEQRNFNDKCFY